jgi:hypothetical protein
MPRDVKAGSIQIWLERELLEQVRELARRDRRSMTSYTMLAVERAVRADREQALRTRTLERDPGESPTGE